MEHDEQVKVIQWFEMQYPKYADLMMAFPSGFVAGGKNKFGLINKMKKEGWKKGVPDLFLALPRKKSAGLWIEMKDVYKTKSSLSSEQIAYLDLLGHVGYFAIWCAGAEDAIKTIKDYMS